MIQSHSQRSLEKLRFLKASFFFVYWRANVSLFPDLHLHIQPFGNLENVALHTGLDFQ